MEYPILNEISTSREMISTFGGYNHNRRISGGEFFDMSNLSSDEYPMLCSRKHRGTVTQMTAPGGLIAKDAMAYVDNGKLFYNGNEVTGLSLTQGEKQLVSMGAYLLIWPDKKYVNTKDLNDCGSMEFTKTISCESSNVSYEMCDMDGNAIMDVVTEEPEEPYSGQYWLDTTQTPHSLRQYSKSNATWVTIPTVYTRIKATGIGEGFSRYDGVKLSGITYPGESESVRQQYADLNATKVIYAVDSENNYIVVVGLIDVNAMQTEGAVTIERSVPDMDFVCEAQNRIWGCKYGMVDGKAVNELYCCVLGDFKNWNRFLGISTDAWAGSVGTDGAWTGCINYMGYPTFFKEDRIHRISISSVGAHQVSDTAARGVQNGSHKSLCVVNEILYYRSRNDICAYDGSFPASVGSQLGEVRYYNAVGGGYDGKYYISMQDSGNVWHLFVFDTEKRIWHREDNTHVMQFAPMDDDLYYIDADTNKMMCVKGTQGTQEGDFLWMAESGIIGYEYPDKKYLSRYNIRLQIEPGGEMSMWMQYDSDGKWVHAGTVKRKGHGTFTLPVIPRRCDHMKFKLTGKGTVRIFSIAKILELGSDVGW